MEKYLPFSSVEKEFFSSVIMEKENKFPDFIFWAYIFMIFYSRLI